jgi:hypothetical protein
MPSQIASLIDMSVLSGVAFAIGIAGIGLWPAAAWWTYGDMARRTNSDLARYGAAGWTVGTPGPRDLRRSGRRGPGFEDAVNDEVPAAIGR